MRKFTASTLKKYEKIFQDAGYIIRYEKGNFQPGYCILEQKKVIVINKYYDFEAKIGCLIDILNEVQLDERLLSEEAMKLYLETRQKEIDV